MWSLKGKAFVNLFWLIKTICNLQQLRVPLRDNLNLVICNDNGPRQGRLKTKVSYAQISVILVFYVCYPEML